MATFQVTPPERFSFKPEEWSKWIRRFERFRLASELNKKDEESQVNTLIYSMGDEADDILQSFVMSADDKKKYNTTITNCQMSLSQHFCLPNSMNFFNPFRNAPVFSYEDGALCLLQNVRNLVRKGKKKAETNT